MKFTGATITVSATVCLCVVLVLAGRRPDCGVPRMETEIGHLEAALKQYKNDFGGYPQGDSAMIANALLGKNDSQVKYLDWKSGSEGFVLDPWGRPYRFSYSVDGEPVIRSLGADGKMSEDDATNR